VEREGCLDMVSTDGQRFEANVRNCTKVSRSWFIRAKALSIYIHPEHSVKKATQKLRWRSFEGLSFWVLVFQ